MICTECKHQLTEDNLITQLTVFLGRVIVDVMVACTNCGSTLYDFVDVDDLVEDKKNDKRHRTEID